MAASIRRPFLLLALIALLSALPNRAHAQGCILARSPEQTGLPTSQGGILQPGHFQVTIGERHQFSYQHYVGDVYQEYRAQAGTEVENRINLVTVNLTYQLTPRISLAIDAPWLWASRKTQNSPIKYQSSGFGDTIISANSWILDPAHASRWNASIGLGLYLPSGNDDLKNNVNTNTTGVGPAVEVVTPVDYSIQPGTGGWGGVLEWSAYSRVGQNLTFYTDGSYIAMNGGTNGVQRSATLSTTQPLNNYDAIADQYLLEAGVEFPIPHVQGLSATVGPRWEGVPAYNVLPVSNDGFRRPGYAVTAGPGLQYARNQNILSAGVYKAVRRDRTVSYPDSVYNSHGDAAFAQYVWLASLTHRF
ncbi:hypothetical protein GCM10011507_33650 [Edaphobacter acidisoli]|uniref:Transporter n=1 Tax=Edaphobacter acidisoli TaxID=2040573 RepID=A0A916W9S1_9BACT|nr:transporter [Edaphobacter acidisoli]GGA79714.1 hypothetical protein GCM10011507_33650 [Edaphobacter acidisoli]